MNTRLILVLAFAALTVASLVLMLQIRQTRIRYIEDPQGKYLRRTKLYTVLAMLIFSFMIIL
ncbi:MAG: hypothetical protein IJI05_06035, partial [Erysipelotrichaceae bacterium]|nr:hypothetical protein [Erysipelotrichaceae bacterium]